MSTSPIWRICAIIAKDVIMPANTPSPMNSRSICLQRWLRFRRESWENFVPFSKVSMVFQRSGGAIASVLVISIRCAVFCNWPVARRWRRILRLHVPHCDGCNISTGFHPAAYCSGCWRLSLLESDRRWNGALACVGGRLFQCCAFEEFGWRSRAGMQF